MRSQILPFLFVRYICSQKKKQKKNKKIYIYIFAHVSAKGVIFDFRAAVKKLLDRFEKKNRLFESLIIAKHFNEI